MKPIRHFDNRELMFEIAAPKKDDPILVVCPKCRSKALVLPDTDNQNKCVCTKCSFNKNGYFRFDLWLETHCCGHSLYAFNIRHLNVLENYIKADLRERRQSEQRPGEYGWRNASLASRFPKWIKSHKNREQLIKAIQKLREKL